MMILYASPELLWDILRSLPKSLVLRKTLNFINQIDTLTLSRLTIPMLVTINTYPTNDFILPATPLSLNLRLKSVSQK